MRKVFTMDELLGILLFAGFIFLIIFPIICMNKLRSINNKLSDIEHRINLLYIKSTPPPEQTFAESAAAPEPKSSPAPAVESKPAAPIVPEAPEMEKVIAPIVPEEPKMEKVLPQPPVKSQTYTAPAKTYSAAWEEKSDKVNQKLSEFEERSAAVFRKVWSWICVGEEFRSKDVAKEYAIATTWLIRLGVIILLCGIGFFLKYSIDRNWTPPVVRVIMMLLAGLAMASVGSWKSQGKYRPLAIALAGAGFVTLYLSIMAAYKLYGLIPPVYAFGFMIAVTVGAMASALGTNALLTALLGCTGGYLTPVFISTGSNNITALFIYMTILGAGTLLVARYRNWVLLNGASFIFYAIIGGMATGKYITPENALPVIGLLALNFAVFGIQNYTASTKRDMTFAEVVLFCANIIFYLAAALPIAHKFFQAWQMPALLTIFMALLASGKIFYMVRKKQYHSAKILAIFLQIELCFALALTVPLLLGSQWVIAAWSILAFLLVDAACKIRSKTLLVFAVIVYIASAWFETYSPQTFNDDYKSFIPQLVNMLVTAGVYIASMTASAIKLIKNSDKFALAETQTTNVVSGLGQIFIAISGLLFFYCTSYELHTAMHYYFITFKSGILVAYWSILVAVSAYLVHKYKLLQLQFIPLALLGLAGVWMVISHREFGGAFWKGFAYTLATASIYIASTVLAAREFAKISVSETLAEKVRKNAKVISIVLYAISGILFFIYSSKELFDGLTLYVVSFRNGGLSVYWSALAFALLVWGLRKQRKVLRLCGIGLFLTVALKIFFIDLAQLEQIWRIVAFAAIGVVMLVGAVVYIRCKDMFIEEKEQK